MMVEAGQRGDERAVRPARPRNRRELISTAASELFYRRGYPSVGMSDIAGAVGIGPSALYRHFTGKQQLLTHVVLEHLRPFHKIPEQVEAGNADTVVGVLACVALDHRELGVLWQRDSRNLDGAERTMLGEQLRVVASRLADLARSYQPELSEEDARFRGWCVFSALTSPSYHRVELPRAQFEAVLRAMTGAIVGRPPRTFDTPRAGEGAASAVAFEHRASRRRLLLQAATRLFADNGYSVVTTEDIGAAVGIAGPSVYNHFASKQELLAAVITRGNSWLELEWERTTARASGVVDALRDLLRSYIRFAVEYRGFIDLLIGEIDHLPEWQRHRARQTQREYVSEWSALLGDARPDIDSAAARILVQAALTVANDMARTGTNRDVEAIAAVGEAILFDTRLSPA